MINVVIVDDSRVMRAIIDSALVGDGDIKVVGAAADPFEARDIIRQTNPDVITLDVEMPRMGGLEFLRRIMDLRPMPVVMVSTTTTQGAENTLTALEIGAVDFVAKPGNQSDWEKFSTALRDTVRVAATAKFAHRPQSKPQPGNPAPPRENRGAPPTTGKPATTPTPSLSSASWSKCELIAIGASTGGVTAINQLLAGLPTSHPPVVIAQHMPSGFTARFASRLAHSTGRNIDEATDGEILVPGAIRLAPGDRHLRIASAGSDLICQLGDDPAIGNHRPSVDAMLNTVAKTLGDRAIGFILTGMGSDGARGLLNMRNSGAYTFGEAEVSCTVYGMPKAAMKLGAVCEELHIDDLATQFGSHIFGAVRTG